MYHETLTTLADNLRKYIQRHPLFATKLHYVAALQLPTQVVLACGRKKKGTNFQAWQELLEMVCKNATNVEKLDRVFPDIERITATLYLEEKTHIRILIKFWKPGKEKKPAYTIKCVVNIKGEITNVVCTR